MAKTALQTTLRTQVGYVQAGSLGLSALAEQLVKSTGAAAQQHGRTLSNRLDTFEDHIANLTAAIAAAQAHANTYLAESRWKKIKNVAIPNLTAARNAFKAEIQSAQAVQKTATQLAKKGKILASTAGWR